MIRDLKPKSYNDLVKVCCFLHCHGSFDDDQLNLNNSISSIDDLYDYLINININKEEAFHISEIVGKGKFQDISESLNDRLPFEFINLCDEFTHLESKGFIISYLNQDMFTMYLYDKYPNEISEAYLKVFKDINHER
jgi:DNA polymerase III alpha subunit (gram-positive type)